MIERDIHIGNRIKEVFKNSGLTAKEFSDRIFKDRVTIYDIFKRKSLDLELLMRISKALSYDFISNEYVKDGNKIFVVVAMEIADHELNAKDKEVLIERIKEEVKESDIIYINRR